jgi:superfamily II RNA helicase
MLVEELMARNLLSAIFATSTVSAGVNFPARTVVIYNSDRFNGQYFANLTATELAQMTGRAGRRGLDLIGFAVIVPGRFMDLKLMKTLFDSPPDPVKSRLNINFPMVLNLLNAFEPSDIPLLLSRSLAAWQSVKKHTAAALEQASKSRYKSFKRHMDFLLEAELIDPQGHLTEWGILATSLRLEHPLVLYAAIRRKGLPKDPMLLASVLGALLDEKSEHSYRYPIDGSYRLVETAVKKFINATSSMVQKLKDKSFAVPNKPCISSASAIYNWALNKNIDRAARILGQDLGDFVRLVRLVAEHLNQLANLKSQRGLSEVAREARSLILAEPII